MELWIELVDKNTPPVMVAIPDEDVRVQHEPVFQQPAEIWIQTDIQPVESQSQPAAPVADSQVKPERDQPLIYNEEIVVSSPGLAVETKPAEPAQQTIGIPQRVQPEEAVVQAVAEPVKEALVAEDQVKSSAAEKGDDCKVEYVLVEDKPTADEAKPQEPVHVESRLNSRGKMDA